jgi:membrane protein implicated in regulation of membrane protease activity
MNKYVLAGIFVLIFFIGVAVIFVNQHVSASDALRGLGDLNPRVMSLLILPIAVVVVIIGMKWHRKREERLWKSAVKKTRASRAKASGR